HHAHAEIEARCLTPLLADAKNGGITLPLTFRIATPISMAASTSPPGLSKRMIGSCPWHFGLLGSKSFFTSSAVEEVISPRIVMPHPLWSGLTSAEANVVNDTKQNESPVSMQR
ncbi:MAG: hypothetical protein K2X06_18050, partial [Burkholderiales bacterium]|nr:hypothetical protein [Burkholderiales bacterium]